MRVTGFWQSWLLPLILVLSLMGGSRGLGAEAPEPAGGSTPTAPAPPPYEPPAPSVPTPAAGHTDLTLHAFRIVGAKTERVKDLKKELSMKLPSFWPPWGTPPPFRLQDLEYDVERLKNFLPPPGFFPHGDQTRNQLWPERGGGCHPED